MPSSVGIQLAIWRARPAVELRRTIGLPYDIRGVLEATATALDELFSALAKRPETVTQVASPKFNSGLFRVEWIHTERLLTARLAEHRMVEWTVFEL
jgi:hypothetical protein